MKDSRSPLRGIKVVELGTYVAAPALGLMLALLGADVIKVEPMEGDVTREVTPWSWANYNSMKRSICLDLKKDKGIKIFKSLAKNARVVVDGLGPGVADRLGIGFNRLKRLNKGIVYCSIKGFSSTGPGANRAAFDTIAQAEAGLMYVTMHRGGSMPVRVGNPCVDLTAAAFGVIGVLSSLMVEAAGPKYVEVPLFDVVAFWNSYWLPYIQIKGSQPVNLGSEHPGFSPYSTYRCSDGYVFIGVLNDRQWVEFVDRLSLRKVLPVSMRTPERIARRRFVDSVVQKRVGPMTRQEVISVLGDAVPCAEVRDLESLLASGEVRSSKRFVDVLDGDAAMKIFLPPVESSIPRKMRLSSKGEHTLNILKSIGYTSNIIDSLQKLMVVC